MATLALFRSKRSPPPALLRMQDIVARERQKSLMLRAWIAEPACSSWRCRVHCSAFQT